jgi:hypothetical protein
LNTAKAASTMAMTAALYAIFFYISSFFASISGFTILYLPVILLGVFPLWFGWNGLIGSMIGAFIGGAFAEQLGFLGIFEAITALIIYIPNWLLLPKKTSEKKGVKNMVLLLAIYATTLFVGTSYILWQYSILPKLWDIEVAKALLLPEFAINFTIMAIICPVLNRVISPKLQNWGVCSGNFWEWRKQRKGAV